MVKQASQILVQWHNYFTEKLNYLSVSLLDVIQPVCLNLHSVLLKPFPWFAMTSLDDGTVAVCEEDNNQNKLKRFSLETGLEISSTNISSVCGMTEVELKGRSTIVVSDPWVFHTATVY